MAFKRGGTLCFPLQDHLKGTAVITNSAGSVVESTTYYPYGATRTGSITTTTASLVIGKRAVNTQFFNGSVDEARVYNRALSATEVQARYLAQPENADTMHYYLGGKEVAFKRGSTLCFPLQDHLKGIAVITNSAGSVVESTTYYPYGQTRSGGITSTDRAFTGQRLDSTGLYYYGARYYDPNIGRFVSPDTIVQNYRKPASFNRYAYAFDNPLKYTDPSGHVNVSDIGGGGWPKPPWWKPATDKLERAVELAVDAGKQGLTQQGEAIAANMKAERAAGEATVSFAVRRGHEIVETVVENQGVVVLASKMVGQNPTGLANDALGLGMAVVSGGDLRVTSDGVVVVENAGGPAGAFMDAVDVPAFTIGHVVFAEGPLQAQSPTYVHEVGGHVPQYEMLGGGFLPLYGGAEVVADGISAVTGGDPHDYNVFEMWADAWSDWWY